MIILQYCNRQNSLSQSPATCLCLFCDGCGDIFSRAVRKCPNCGWEIPKREVQKMETADKAEKRMHEAIKMHVDGLLEDGLPVPEQQAVAEYVVV